MEMTGKRRGGPWYGEERPRILFERSSRHIVGLYASRTRRGSGRGYRFPVEVPGYERRQVEVLFLPSGPPSPQVRVDGPEESPHRYRDGTLCLYHPLDPVGQRWVVEDGLLALVGLIATHLFREAWWREHGEWLGPEAAHAHDDGTGKPDASEERAA